MWKFVLIIFLFSSVVYSQQNNSVGITEQTVNDNGILKTHTVLTPEVNNGIQNLCEPTYNNPTFIADGNTSTRWFFTDSASIGNHCAVSGNGNYNVTGWDLNTERVSFYGNLNSTPIWEFFVNPEVSKSHVTISDTGGVIAVGSYRNIYLFNNTSNTPIFSFNNTTYQRLCGTCWHNKRWIISCRNCIP
jgi:hypothetical protein